MSFSLGFGAVLGDEKFVYRFNGLPSAYLGLRLYLDPSLFAEFTRSRVVAVSLVRSSGPSLVGNGCRCSIKFRDIDGERLVIRSCAILQDAERDLLTQ